MKHFVIAYKRDSGDLLEFLAVSSRAEARRHHLELEVRYRPDPFVELVVLSGDEATLRRTHSRYFVKLNDLQGRFEELESLA
ncbi:MAG: hypothetical protein ACLGH3_05675 [Actinomycetota bacterium]